MSSLFSYLACFTRKIVLRGRLTQANHRMNYGAFGVENYAIKLNPTKLECDEDMLIFLFLTRERQFTYRAS